MTITKERWAEIEAELNHLFSLQAFRADGYVVSARLSRLKNRLLIEVHVNGYIRGEWAPRRGKPMAEEARRFWRHTTKAVAPKAFISKFEKAFGKRSAKARGLYDTWVWAEPYFLSAKAFVRHLRKHNTDITEMSDQDYLEYLHAIKEPTTEPTTEQA